MEQNSVAINRSGKRLFDKALSNDDNKLCVLMSDLKQHDQILLVVDQPANIGAFYPSTARIQPHALHTLKLADEQIAELSMLCGFDDALAVQTVCYIFRKYHLSSE